MTTNHQQEDRMTHIETAYVSHYFGVCPECHRTDGYLNVGSGHWFYCQQHHTRWCVGSNLFDSWKLETEDEQRDIYDRVGFSRFRDVEPFHPDDGMTALPTDHDCYDFADWDDYGYLIVDYCTRCGTTLQVGGRSAVVAVADELAET